MSYMKDSTGRRLDSFVVASTADVTAAVAAAPTVVDAAATAVSARAASMALQQRVMWGPITEPSTITLATLSGTPAYTSGKLSGGALDYVTPAAITDPACTTNGCFEARCTIAANPAATRNVFTLDTGFGFGISATGQLRATINAGGRNVGGAVGAAWADNAQHHIAIEFVAGVAHLYLDGVLIATDTVAIGAFTSGHFAIGRGYSSVTAQWPNTIDELRVTKGVRYGNAFTAPAAPFAWDDNTVFLAHLSDANASIRVPGGEGYQHPGTTAGAHLDPAGWYHFYGPDAPMVDVFNPAPGVLPDSNDWTVTS